VTPIVNTFFQNSKNAFQARQDKVRSDQRQAKRHIFRKIFLKNISGPADIALAVIQDQPKLHDFTIDNCMILTL
jgi:hypothetical protein